MGFEDFDSAARTRDVITAVCRQVIDQVRPRITYATVASIDRPNKKVYVTFPGDSGSVPASMNSLQPNAVGQVVRIEGEVGDRFVGDVIGPSGSAVVQALRVLAGTAADTTAAEPFFSGGSFSGMRMLERDSTTRAWTIYPKTQTFKVYASNTNRNIFGLNDAGQGWFSAVGHFLDANGEMTPINSHALIVASNQGSGLRPWTNAALNLRTADLSAAQPELGISFWCQGVGTAPMIRHYGNAGEVIDFVNNANNLSNYITIRAGAFTVISSQSFKKEIRGLDLNVNGPRVNGQPKPAGQARWVDALKALRAKRWKRLPTWLTSGHIHVCGQDCDRSLADPCPIGFEDARDQVGFIADELALVFPDAVKFDQDTRTPLGIDIVALLAFLWEAVNELLGRVEALEARTKPVGA